MLDLETIDNRCKLTENLVRLLVILELSSNQICKVAKRLGRIKDLQ